MKIRKFVAAAIVGTATIPAAAAFAHSGGHGDNTVATIIHFLTQAPHNLIFGAAIVATSVFVFRAVKKTRS